MFFGGGAALRRVRAFGLVRGAVPLLFVPAAVTKDALCHMPGKSVHLGRVILSSGVNSGSLREGENSSISYRFLTQTRAPATAGAPPEKSPQTSGH